MALSQVGFRGRNDDGSETSATWKAAQNTNFSQLPGQKFRLRIEVQTDGTSLGSQFFAQLQYNKNGAGWNVAGAGTSVVQCADSSSVTNGTPCTDQLTAGTGSYQPGEIDENNCIAATGDVFGANQNAEFEFVLVVVDADTNPDDTIQLRVRHNGGAAIDSYPAIPTVTVMSIGPATLGVAKLSDPYPTGGTYSLAGAKLAWLAGAGTVGALTLASSYPASGGPTDVEPGPIAGQGYQIAWEDQFNTFTLGSSGPYWREWYMSSVFSSSQVYAEDGKMKLNFRRADRFPVSPFPALPTRTASRTPGRARRSSTASTSRS